MKKEIPLEADDEEDKDNKGRRQKKDSLRRTLSIKDLLPTKDKLICVKKKEYRQL